MKTLKAYALLLLLITIISCSSDTEEELNISKIYVSVSEIERTTVKINYNLGLNGRYIEVLYKERNSNNDFQSINLTTNKSSNYNDEITLQNLNPATSYEIRIQISNSKTNLQSEPYYFVTKAIDIDYDVFYNYSLSGAHTSPYEVFSHINKEHKFIAKGISDFDDVKLFLVNEEKTDSLEISREIVLDTLIFTIPKDYLQQSPRETVKRAYLGIKIKESYEYIINENTYLNLSYNPDYKNSSNPFLKFRIYNDQPYISHIELTTGSNTTCSNYTNINFTGGFMGSNNSFYWSSVEAVVSIFDSNNILYGSYSTLEKKSSTCNKFSLGIASAWEDNILIYQSRKNALLHSIPDLPPGNYTTKISFTLENGEYAETNMFNFTKE